MNARRLAILALPIAALFAAIQPSNAQSRGKFEVVSSGCDVKPAIGAFARYLGPTKYTNGANWNGYQDAGWQPPKGFRHITWDGVARDYVDRDYIPENYFNTALKQGLLYKTNGKGSRVSSDYYGYLNPSYGKQFKAWSPNYVFSPLYSNVVDFNFEVPGYANDRGWVHGFGAIFSDVDRANVTRMEFFDEYDKSLGLWYVQPCDYGNSFLGVYFYDNWVTKVRVWLGDKPLDAYTNDDAYNDVVVLDDLWYDEPWKYGWKGYKGASEPYAPPADPPKY
jgi:hypothetical protein